MNTYKDDPTKGLSRLQKAILDWIVKPSRFASPNEPAPIGKTIETRPTFSYPFTTNKFGYSRSNSAAFSRALASLEWRRLIGKSTKGGKVVYVELTKAGQEYVKRLVDEDEAHQEEELLNAGRIIENNYLKR